MASADKAPIIIIKKKKGGGGHGHHGGAWKVAYADFVTAMMAFFLVLWLLGSDEEVKDSISSYFNNPTSAWRPDLQNPQQAPLGEMTGSGDNLLQGNGAGVPEDLIERPSQPNTDSPPGTTPLGDQQNGVMNDRMPPADLEIQVMRFAVPEELLFEAGTSKLTSTGKSYLKRFEPFLKQYKGKVSVKGFLSPTPSTGAGDPYEFALARAVSLSDYLADQHWVDRERVAADVSDEAGRSPAQADGPDARRRLEISFGQ